MRGGRFQDGFHGAASPSFLESATTVPAQLVCGWLRRWLWLGAVPGIGLGMVWDGCRLAWRVLFTAAGVFAGKPKAFNSSKIQGILEISEGGDHDSHR